MARSSGYESGELADTAVHVLLALLEPRHGYAVMQFLEQQSDEAITLGPASLYTTLKKLDRAEFIEEADTDGGSRRVYHITTKGYKALIQSIDRRRQLLKIADQIMEEA